MKSFDRRKDSNRGVGDGLSRSFELIVTPALFAGLGLLLDRWLGITPVLTIVFAVLGVVGTFLSTWYRYDAEMRELEARRGRVPEAARPGSAA